jgi:hypothetical protein
MASPASRPSKHPVPYFYRLALCTVEPLFALNGAIMLFNSPPEFLNIVTPYAPAPPSALSSSSSLYNSSSTTSTSSSTTASAVLSGSVPRPSPPASLADARILTDQLAAFILVFAVQCAIGLRMTRSVRMWRMLCGSMLVSDVLHISATIREARRGCAGGDMAEAYAGVPWRYEDFLNFTMLGFFTVVRIALLLGIGLRRGYRDAEIIEEEEHEGDAKGELPNTSAMTKKSE